MSYTHHKQALTFALERAGFVVSEKYASNSVNEQSGLLLLEGAARWQAWIPESLLTGFRALERGEHELALRCLLQAHSYQGRLGGFWPGPQISDAAAALQHALEARLVAGGRS